MDKELFEMFRKAEDIQDLRFVKYDKKCNLKFYRYKIGDMLYDSNDGILWKMESLNDGWSCAYNPEYKRKHILILPFEKFFKLSNDDWKTYFADLIENYKNVDSIHKASLMKYMFDNFNKKWNGKRWVVYE